ncbi:transcription repressor OFP6-like [Melia azedarach]|uniref:Transcription repressor OFP6-like n=1 Tax=Melia azedarach TaxID=155640 RepID=A0ACC1X1K6_MELAZ|nr:transcription repressor OFP6-like [Melia azedarach]
MPTATTRKKLILNTVAVSLGCGSSCRKPKLSFLFHPKPKPKKSHYQKHQHSSSLYTNNSSSSSSSLKTTHTEYYDTASATTFSPNMETPVSHYWDAADVEYSRTVRGFGRVGGESVAVQKDSDDPYLDFRHSMLQMILEKEIYSKDDLKELLNCFLQLNSPYHHEIIVRAFTEIWNGLFSVKSSSGSCSSSKLRYSGYGCK